MTAKEARWRRYYMGHLAKEQARGRAYYWAHREAILARRKAEKERKKREEKAC